MKKNFSSANLHQQHSPNVNPCHHYGSRLKDCCQPHLQHYASCCKMHTYHSHCCQHQTCCTHNCYTKPKQQYKALAKPETPQQDIQQIRLPQSKSQPQLAIKDLTLDQKFMNLLKKRNQNYFLEKGTLCCKKKPPKNKLDLLRSVPKTTTYKRDYPKHPLPKKGTETNINKWPAHKGQFPCQSNTEYRNQYPQHPVQPKKPKQQKPQLEKAPFNGNTQYKLSYPQWGDARSFPLKPSDTNKNVKGLPLNGRTTYKKDFVPKDGQKRQPIIQMAKTAMSGFDFPKKTMYNDQYRKWDPFGDQFIRTKQKFEPLQSFPGQYSTQYKGQFLPKHGNALNKCAYKLVDGFHDLMDL